MLKQFLIQKSIVNLQNSCNLKRTQNQSSFLAYFQVRFWIVNKSQYKLLQVLFHFHLSNLYKKLMKHIVIFVSNFLEKPELKILLESVNKKSIVLHKAIIRNQIIALSYFPLELFKPERIIKDP